MVTNEISEGDLYLDDFWVEMLNEDKCYIVANYTIHGVHDKKRYAYYTEDPQVIQDLLQWAKTNVARYKKK